MPAPDAEWRARTTAEARVRAAMKGGEHGHELKIRRPGGFRAPAPWRGRRATPLPLQTARGRRDGPGRGSAKGQVTGPPSRRPPTEGGGRAVPRIWLEQNETSFTAADAGRRRRISPVSTTPRFRALPPRHAPDPAARRRAKDRP